MKESEKIEFEKYHDIAEAVKECIEKKERDRLISLISHRKGSDDFMRKMASKEEFREAVDFMQESFKKRNTDKLEKSIRAIERRATIRRRMMIASSTVAAAVIAVCFLLYTPNEKIESKEIALTKLHTPTLMLDDSVVILSSTESKIVAANYSAKTIGNRAQSDNVVQQRLIIPSGQTYTVILEDGTEVMLNADSELSYPSRFSGDKREVSLKGEAYFDVTKSEKPFIVHTKGSYIKVYGTSFNVNAKVENEVKTVLVEGKVGVGAEGVQERIISPNQLITLNTKMKTSFIEDVESSNYLGWKEGYFKCIDSEFIPLIEEISSWYDVEFKYNKEILSNFKVTVSLRRELPIADVLRYLQDITELKFIKTGVKSYDIERMN